ncbi:hypothetical protein L0Y49_03635 [bacterium]|nr:hypothetical protein [bacterium]
MNIKDYFFLCGSFDPEMDCIFENLFRQRADYAEATVNSEPVTPGNAYRADMPEGGLPGDKKIVFIECGIQGVTPDIRIDHHRHGDFGYDLGPDKFFEASSLGQLFNLLDLQPSYKELVIAAGDHCFSDAMNGKCPGIDPKDVRKKKWSDIHAKVSRIGAYFMDVIASAPQIDIGGQKIAFIRESVGMVYSVPYLALQTVATETNTPIILRSQDTEMDPWRLQLGGGPVTPDTVILFMNEWGPAHGLKNIYGVPSRGYAGGYIEGEFNKNDYLS